MADPTEGLIDLSTLSAATLRQLLSEAESRERTEVERARSELERERIKMQSEHGQDPAHGVPVHLRSIARALPPVLTMRQCRSVLKVSAKTLRRWIEEGKLAASQHGAHGKVLITRDAVLALLGATKGEQP